MRWIALPLLLGILFTAVACNEKEDATTDEDSTPTLALEATDTEPPLEPTDTPPPPATDTPIPPTATEPPPPPPPTNTPVVENCDRQSYPDVCIPPYPPDLDCGDIPFRRFTVRPPDPHGFDGDADGIGCESG